MPRNKIKESLEEIKSEINALGEDSSSKLKPLETKVDRALKEIDQTEDDSLRDLFEGIDGSISDFEASHPRITSSLNQVMSLLSSMGI